LSADIQISSSSRTQARILLTKGMGRRVDQQCRRSCVQGIHCSIWGKRGCEQVKPQHAHGACKSTNSVRIYSTANQFCRLTVTTTMTSQSSPTSLWLKRLGLVPASWGSTFRNQSSTSRTLLNSGLPAITPIWTFIIWRWTTSVYQVIFLLCFLLSVTNFILASYIHGCWMCLLAGSPTPLFYSQSPLCLVCPCLPLHGVLGPEWPYLFWGCSSHSEI